MFVRLFFFALVVVGRLLACCGRKDDGVCVCARARR